MKVATLGTKKGYLWAHIAFNPVPVVKSPESHLARNSLLYESEHDLQGTPPSTLHAGASRGGQTYMYRGMVVSDKLEWLI